MDAIKTQEAPVTFKHIISGVFLPHLLKRNETLTVTGEKYSFLAPISNTVTSHLSHRQIACVSIFSICALYFIIWKD